MMPIQVEVTRRLDADEDDTTNGNVGDYPECFLFQDAVQGEEDAFDAEKHVKCAQAPDLTTIFKNYPTSVLDDSKFFFGSNSESVYVVNSTDATAYDKQTPSKCADIDMIQTLNFRLYPTVSALATISNTNAKTDSPAFDNAVKTEKNWLYSTADGIVSNFGVYLHMPPDDTDNVIDDLMTAVSTYYSTPTANDESIITTLKASGRFALDKNTDIENIALSGQFARSFCWAHGCDFDSEVEATYTYAARDGVRRLADEPPVSQFGYPIATYNNATPVFSGNAKLCKDFDNNSNSTASVMQFGIVLATAFYALLI